MSDFNLALGGRFVQCFCLIYKRKKHVVSNELELATIFAILKLRRTHTLSTDILSIMFSISFRGITAFGVHLRIYSLLIFEFAWTFCKTCIASWNVQLFADGARDSQRKCTANVLKFRTKHVIFRVHPALQRCSPTSLAAAIDGRTQINADNPIPRCSLTIIENRSAATMSFFDKINIYV